MMKGKMLMMMMMMIRRRMRKRRMFCRRRNNPTSPHVDDAGSCVVDTIKFIRTTSPEDAIGLL